jgi:hypothetical protein
VEEPLLPADERQDAIAFLVETLPYVLLVRFLSALQATARGDDAQASREYLETSGRARLLLLEAGFATDDDFLDPVWDRVLLQAARRAVRDGQR